MGWVANVARNEPRFRRIISKFGGASTPTCAEAPIPLIQILIALDGKSPVVKSYLARGAAPTMAKAFVSITLV